MKEQSIAYEQIEQNFETIRLGVKQRTIDKDIDKCYITTIYKPQPSPPLYAILTNHQIVYLFNRKFGIQKGENSNEAMLAQYCQAKINLRLEYKLPSLLHIKMKYSYNFQCVFIMLANAQIAIFTDQFYLIGYVDIVCCDQQNSIKYCLDFQYYEKQAVRSSRKIKSGFFAFLFSDSLEIHEVQILTNHKLSKFKPSYKVSIVQLSKHIVNNQIQHPVNLQLFSFFRSHHFTKTSEKMNNCMYLAANCLKEVTFQLINKDSMSFEQNIKVGKTHLNGTHIMDIEISPLNKRFFFGLNNGTIKAVSFKQQTFNQLLYTTKISQSSILKIYLQSSQKMLVYSKDGGLSILNLLTLSIQQRFKLGDSIQFFFINEYHFLSVGNKSHSSYNNNQLQLRQSDFSRLLILNQFNCKYEKVFEYNSQIISYKLDQNSEIIQLSDNSLLINQHIGNKIEVMQTYLPPRSVSVRCIHKNPFTNMEQYWILTQKSQIYKYCVIPHRQVNVSDVLQLYRFLDRNDTQHRYIVSYFCFLTKIVPMQYDSETTEKQYIKNHQTNQQLKPICLGTNTGQILITSINSILNIVCRMRSLSTIITNIIQVHPILPSQSSKGLLIYDSKKCQKMIIVELGASQHPVEHFRLASRGAKFQTMTQDLFVIINAATFCTFYAKQQNNECYLYREEHYNPGLIENSKITAISRCAAQSDQYIVVGYSMGQIIIYKLARNVNQTTYISLSLMYLLQNSKQQPIQFVRFDSHKIYFNLGSFLVLNSLPEVQLKVNQNNINQNYKLDKNKERRQFNFPQKIEHVKKQIAHSAKFIEQQKQRMFPKVKITKKKSDRSSSMGVIKSGKIANVKPEFMFHFPDIHLYRSLIKKNIVH